MMATAPPATASAQIYVITNPVIFEIGTYKTSGEVANNDYGQFSHSGPVTGAFPGGISWRDIGGFGVEFYGTAQPGSITGSPYSITLEDGFHTTAIIRKGPQTIVQLDISKSISDGSFTVTPQSKDGNGDVINVGAVDPALVALHQPTYTFSSSDPTIATINSTTGEVTLVAEGTTTITVNSAATESYRAAAPITFDLTVTPEVSNPPAQKDVPQAVVGIAALGLLILLVNRKKKKS